MQHTLMKASADIYRHVHTAITPAGKDTDTALKEKEKCMPVFW